MELVANVWPIVDQMTGVVQRFLFRAYALDATDQEKALFLTYSLVPTIERHS
ncbi:hypothetical protein [Psychrobacter sp. WY6]|uniref:hypothetical protein n=1 Tax=Psychrobacter sp. WY6 TaxID=2708350 RepID=UPI002022E7E6|nr:hypothetical protein [Psychrobacter sp. WY6]